MLFLDRKKHGIHFYTVWFAETPFRKKGVIAYREAKFMPNSKIQPEKFDTLITDLDETEDEIKGHFAKNCKYEVNRAFREDVEVEILLSQDIENSDIVEFCDFFVEFWKSKDAEYHHREQLYEELSAYRDLGALAIGQSFVHGEKAIYHTYIVGPDWVRLLHSASLYRLSKDEDGRLRTLIGMANRNLHYQEMLLFKRDGKTVYDWGGAGKDEEVAAITKFKESFGGTPLQCYEFEETRGFLAHLFKLIVKILKK